MNTLITTAVTNTEFNEKAFNALSEPNKQRIEWIYRIALLAKENGKPKMEPDDFDMLYDASLVQLEIMYGRMRFEIDMEKMGIPGF